MPSTIAVPPPLTIKKLVYKKFIFCDFFVCFFVSFSLEKLMKQTNYSTKIFFCALKNSLHCEYFTPLERRGERYNRGLLYFPYNFALYIFIYGPTSPQLVHLKLYHTLSTFWLSTLRKFFFNTIQTLILTFGGLSGSEYMELYAKCIHYLANTQLFSSL